MLKGWRTWIVNALIASPIIIQEVERQTGIDIMREIVPPEMLSYYVIALAAANMYMRVITTTPLGKNS